MCEQGFCTYAVNIPGGAICRSHGQCNSGHCWEWFDDDWCLSGEGEPCNTAIGGIDDNTDDYYTVRDRGDADGNGWDDLRSRHHHAVRDNSWYGEDHKVRCINWNAINSYSSTHYCEANLCRTDRGYNQNCNTGSQCNSGICYEGKCMATCASGVLRCLGVYERRPPQPVRAGRRALQRRQPVRLGRRHVDVLHRPLCRRGAGRLPPGGHALRLVRARRGVRLDQLARLWHLRVQRVQRVPVRRRQPGPRRARVPQRQRLPVQPVRLVGGRLGRHGQHQPPLLPLAAGGSVRPWPPTAGPPRAGGRLRCGSQHGRALLRQRHAKRPHHLRQLPVPRPGRGGQHWRDVPHAHVRGPLQSTIRGRPLCWTNRAPLFTELCRWDGHCVAQWVRARLNGCERLAYDYGDPNGQAPDGTICTTDAQCGDNAGTSICYYAGFLSAVAGVNTKICRPPGTRCDWCEQAQDCDTTNQRGFGYFRCNEFNECIYDGRNQAPDAAECENDDDCQSGQCHTWAGDRDGTGNILRRFCRSQEGGICGTVNTVREGHPTLPVNYDVVANTGGHCWGNLIGTGTQERTKCVNWEFHGFTIGFHGSGEQSRTHVCHNNQCTTEAPYGVSYYWDDQCASGNCDGDTGDNDAYKQCMHIDGQGADGDKCNTDAQCGGTGGLSFCCPTRLRRAGRRASARHLSPSAAAAARAATRTARPASCAATKSATTSATRRAATSAAAAASARRGDCATFPFDTDEIADPDINRRYCASNTGESCGELTINAGHCTGSFNDRLTYCQNSNVNYCDNNVCSTNRAYGQACTRGRPVRVGNCGHGICLHARNSYAGYSDHSSGHYCVYDDQCSRRAALRTAASPSSTTASRAATLAMRLPGWLYCKITVWPY